MKYVANLFVLIFAVCFIAIVPAALCGAWDIVGRLGVAAAVAWMVFIGADRVS